jgi:hypothetical protein
MTLSMQARMPAAAFLVAIIMEILGVALAAGSELSPAFTAIAVSQ